MLDPDQIADQHQQRQEAADLAARRGWRRQRRGRLVRVLVVAGLATAVYALQAWGGGHLARPLAVLLVVGLVQTIAVALLVAWRPGLLTTIALHLGLFLLLSDLSLRYGLLVLGPATGLLARAGACALAFWLGFENQYGEGE